MKLIMLELRDRAGIYMIMNYKNFPEKCFQGYIKSASSHKLGSCVQHRGLIAKEAYENRVEVPVEAMELSSGVCL